MARAPTDFDQDALRPPAVMLVAGLGASFYVWLVLVTTIPYPGKIGLDYNTLGTDWMVFYGAIRSILEGHTSLVYDGGHFTDFLNATFVNWLSTPLDFRPWTYPPSFLIFLLPFASLGFFGSYVAFQIVTAGVLAITLRLIAPSTGSKGVLVAMALLCPAAAINVIDGQCAFLVAALIVGGFGLMESRPVVGGLILGLLTFKPQFCLLVPVALIAAGCWRALLASAVSLLGMICASGLVFGWDLWIRWFPLIWTNLNSSNDRWIQSGRMWGNSVYTCAVLLGVPERMASAVQLLAICIAVAAVIVAFRSRLGTTGKTAVFLASTLLAAPHSGPYDAVLLVIAAALWLLTQSASQSTWRWTLMFVIWFLPIFSPPLLFVPGRVGPLVTGLLIVLLLRPELRKVLTRERSIAS